MMRWWTQLPVIVRTRALIIMMVLLGFVSFKYGVARAIGTYKLAMALEAENTALEKDRLSLRVNQEGGSEHIVKIQESTVIKSISDFCDSNDIAVRSITQAQYRTSDSLTVDVNNFVVEADFQKSLALLYRLERAQNGVPITSAEWQLTKEDSGYALVTSFCIKNIVYEK